MDLSSSPDRSLRLQIRKEYRAAAPLDETLRGFLRAAVTASSARSGRVCLCRPGLGLVPQSRLVIDTRVSKFSLPAEQNPRCARCPLSGAAAEAEWGVRQPRASATRLEAALASRSGSPLGLLTLHEPIWQGDGAGCLEWLAERMVHQVARFHTRQSLHTISRLDLMLVGTSEALSHVDAFIEKAAPTTLPVVIAGESGVEKDYVACAIHVAGPLRDGPFLKVAAATLDAGYRSEDLLDLVRRAAGGTLFLSDIDGLASDVQAKLSAILDALLGLSLAGLRQQEPTTRVIAATTHDLATLCRAGAFSRSLLTQLECFSLFIPPLRERLEDIGPLVDFHLHKQGRSAVRFTPEVVAALEGYAWPGNVAELERLIHRLALCAVDGVVRFEDLPGYASTLLPSDGAQGAGADHPAAAEAGLRAVHLPTLLEQLLAGQWEPPLTFHPALHSALRFLAANFTQPLTLTAVAKSANVSSSHLSFLLRSTLGANFKRLLTHMRLRRAQRLLVEHPHEPITSVASEAGFGGLGHFERNFHRAFDCTPRAYRRAAAAPDRVPRAQGRRLP